MVGRRLEGVLFEGHIFPEVEVLLERFAPEVRMKSHGGASSEKS